MEGSQGHGVVARLAQPAAGMRGGSRLARPDLLPPFWKLILAIALGKGPLRWSISIMQKQGHSHLATAIWRKPQAPLFALGLGGLLTLVVLAHAFPAWNLHKISSAVQVQQSLNSGLDDYRSRLASYDESLRVASVSQTRPDAARRRATIVHGLHEQLAKLIEMAPAESDFSRSIVAISYDLKNRVLTKGARVEKMSAVPGDFGARWFKEDYVPARWEHEKVVRQSRELANGIVFTEVHQLNRRLASSASVLLLVSIGFTLWYSFRFAAVTSIALASPFAEMLTHSAPTHGNEGNAHAVSPDPLPKVEPTENSPDSTHSQQDFTAPQSDVESAPTQETGTTQRETGMSAEIVQPTTSDGVPDTVQVTDPIPSQPVEPENAPAINQDKSSPSVETKVEATNSPVEVTAESLVQTPIEPTIETSAIETPVPSEMSVLSSPVAETVTVQDSGVSDSSSTPPTDEPVAVGGPVLQSHAPAVEVEAAIAAEAPIDLVIAPEPSVSANETQATPSPSSTPAQVAERKADRPLTPQVAEGRPADTTIASNGPSEPFRTLTGSELVKLEGASDDPTTKKDF